MMKNMLSLTEKVTAVASKGKKLSREFKEYFRWVGLALALLQSLLLLN